MAIHVFPLELREDRKEWPFMDFSVGYGKEHIFLPIPMGLAFADQMSYSTIDLGVIQSMKLGSEGGGLLGGLLGKSAGGAVTGSLIGSMAGGISAGALSANKGAAASIALRAMKQDDIADRMDFANKQVFAPNTNAKFDNSTIRQYSFQFKMIGRTKKEIESINKIRKIFQEYMYPEGDDVIMKYPPRWEIFFYDGLGNENVYLPGIYECYLTGMNALFNGSTNVFHEDGSPVEADITVSFQETKALTRREIQFYNPGEPMAPKLDYKP